MTEYAVAVEYTGDFIVEAENEDEARAHVEAIIPSSTPDSDWYFVQIVGVRDLDDEQARWDEAQDEASRGRAEGCEHTEDVP